MACWHHWRFWLVHQPVLEIYHDDNAESLQAQQVLGDGGVGVWINAQMHLQ